MNVRLTWSNSHLQCKKYDSDATFETVFCGNVRLTIIYRIEDRD